MHLLAFFDFLPKCLMFPQIIRSTYLDTPRLQQSRKKKTRSRGQQCCGSMQTDATLLRYASRSQNNTNVGTCWAKSLTGFKLYATGANKYQHCCGSMQTDATSHNIVGPNSVGCCWPTMLDPFAWALRQLQCGMNLLQYKTFINTKNP